MTKEEAIKYLQQLYPNGGHCWLDEQRIEAIGMAVKALQEEPVNKDLGKENKIEILADIIFNAAKHGYMPYDTQDENCAMEIAKRYIDKFIATKKQENPVSEDLEEASKNYALNNTPWDDCKDEIQESFKAGVKWQKQKDSIVSEDFEKIIEEIAEPTILNAYGTKELAKRLRNTICGTSVSEDLKEASKKWLSPKLDKSYANYEEAKMMELTHFDGYAMLDAIEFGAKWQKQQDQSTIELAEDHAMLAGMEKMKEQMMTKSIEAVVSQVPCSNEIILYNPSSVDRYYLPQEMNKLGLNKGDKIKLVIIKED